MGAGDWSINVAAAQSILSTAETQAADFDTNMAALSTAIGEAVIAAKDSLTASALLEVGTDPIGADGATAKAWVLASVEVTRTAIQEYVAGDYEMATTTEKKMEFDN